MMNVLEMSRAALPLLVVVPLLRALLKNELPRQVFPLLWSIAAIRLLVPVAIPFRFSIHTLLEAMYAWVKGLMAAPIRVVPETLAPNPSLPLGNATAVPQAALPSVASLPWWLIPWLMGVCLLGLYFLITYVRCRRLFFTALPVSHPAIDSWLRANPLRRPVSVRESDRIRSPLTYGIVRPVILLPKGACALPHEKLTYILAHEQGHIRRFDTARKGLLTLALCVHWFNPLVLLMFLLANRDIELACDERVIHAFGAQFKSSYALTLIGMETQGQAVSPLMSSFSKYAIEEGLPRLCIRKIIPGYIPCWPFCWLFAWPLCSPPRRWRPQMWPRQSQLRQL